jgi:hypothetical protein
MSTKERMVLLLYCCNGAEQGDGVVGGSCVLEAVGCWVLAISDLPSTKNGAKRKWE